MESKYSNRVIEKLNQIAETLPNLTPKEVISYWISAELEEAEMLYRLSESFRDIAQNNEIANVFLELARESAEHAEALLDAYKKAFHNEEILHVSLPSLEVVLQEELLSRFLKDGNYMELLKALREVEMIAHKTYLYLSEYVEDEKLRDIFKWLAEEELRHYEMLNNLYQTQVPSK
ncbi:ferritin-like domain-containing protein [Thermococcus alcaliphilus]|uniref:ferritin-like domain-containing protein n=1 Tax=Thermococcus alcaliphilus TaxID=139207 RepID=UPI00209130B0|nr:ferritin family protein [Thermococcus alcaliphilus]MCO6042061.1 ferritin family protein [Thermococcus alcaliphilus]